MRLVIRPTRSPSGVNRVLGRGDQPRRGKVFADRYHLTVITSPTQAHHAISYVLGNWRHHDEDRCGLSSTRLVDPFSSAISFPEWTELQDQPWMWPIRETYDPLVVFRPTTWLLREGWKRAGTISARDIPGQRTEQA